ncbi:DUF4031 domain-containing protein [Ideonella sp. DXS29W]|uniref:DUF4031 domain-containing protein n=1 Tax=Ideonella lacteola TaxID=2984193 RepID=A0ABU9BT61_9BURK
MAVYVDNMRAPFRGRLMCHMVADTDDELHEMADRLGLPRRSHQKPGTPHSHYDITVEARAVALQLGALDIGRRQLVMLIRRKRAAMQHVNHCAG